MRSTLIAALKRIMKPSPPITAPLPRFLKYFLGNHSISRRAFKVLIRRRLGFEEHASGGLTDTSAALGRAWLA
jgi:hypothetical protein